MTESVVYESAFLPVKETERVRIPSDSPFFHVAVAEERGGRLQPVRRGCKSLLRLQIPDGSVAESI